MKKTLLEIKNLKVKVEGKEILKGINLKIGEGEIQTLLGPNASGKSTLAQVILGNPKYKVIQGKILFLGQEIKKLSPEKRAKIGLALAWQTPPPIRGVKFWELLNKISKEKIILEEAETLFERDLNVDFSGGEKKIAELIQVLALKPKLAIFDEIDSGLDMERVERVAKIIKEKFIDQKVSILLITHSGEILKYLRPDLVSVMVDGKIVCQSKDFKKVLRTIKKYGYEKCKECFQKI